jgi:hypothetical protein
MDKPTEYVTLVSNDGYEFKILRTAACIAGTIKKALDPTCSSFTPTVMCVANISQLASEKIHKTALTCLR